MPKNTTQCPRPRLEPVPLTPESSALTMRPPRRSPYGALLANIKMECQRWPQKPFILERSGTQYVVKVTKCFSLYCGAHKNISLSCNINIPSFIGNLWWVLLLGNHLKSNRVLISELTSKVKGPLILLK